MLSRTSPLYNFAVNLAQLPPVVSQLCMCITLQRQSQTWCQARTPLGYAAPAFALYPAPMEADGLSVTSQWLTPVLYIMFAGQLLMARKFFELFPSSSTKRILFSFKTNQVKEM